jgi:hypothetical protein
MLKVGDLCVPSDYLKSNYAIGYFSQVPALNFELVEITEVKRKQTENPAYYFVVVLPSEKAGLNEYFFESHLKKVGEVKK